MCVSIDGIKNLYNEISKKELLKYPIPELKKNNKIH